MRDALGCDDVTCAAELGGALGSELMVTGSVGKLGSKLSVTLKLFNVAEVKVVARAHQTTQDIEDAYADAVRAAVKELFAAAPAGVVADRRAPPEDPVARPAEDDNALGGLVGINWSSTRVDDSSDDYYWTVNFSTGEVGYRAGDDRNGVVRCVRSVD